MMMGTLRYILILVLGLICARAETMIPLSIEEMAQRADLILLGTVESKSCQRDEKGQIYTKIDLSVKEVWKGKVASNALQVVMSGGVLGEERVIVSGQVEYDIDEEVVVFIVFNPAREAVTLGMSQGKFRVWLDKQSGKKLARNPVHGGGLEQKPKLSATQSAPPTEFLTLETLKQKVTK